MVSISVRVPRSVVMPANSTDTALIGGTPSVLFGQDLSACPPPCRRPRPASLDCLPGWSVGKRPWALQPKSVEIVSTCEVSTLQVDIGKG